MLYIMVIVCTIICSTGKILDYNQPSDTSNTDSRSDAY
jgi:hypothetical protein